MTGRRHRNERRNERQAHQDLLRWLAAEDEGDEAGAEAALGSLFQALPRLEPSPDLSRRVLAETVWAVGPSAAEAARGWWRAVAVLAGLAAVTVLAGSAVVPSLVGLLDPAALLAGSFEALVALAHTIGGWSRTVVHLVDVLPWLGSATLLVASSPQAVVALTLGTGLTALAIKVLHQVVERDRRFSYAEAN